ncbi:MAG: hypothetical protein E7551_02920 [Ruminococcaceae bacterium]|nr:hypothetical protein [Oscillospiraceae bacterium]
MSTFNELMQKYVNTDYSVLLSLAKEAVSRLIGPCRTVDPQYNGNYMLCSLVLSAIGADGVLTALEKKLLGDVLGLDEQGIQKMLSMYNSGMPDLANHFADNMGEDTKADAIMLITIFAAVDEKISREETAFIRKLFQ